MDFWTEEQKAFVIYYRSLGTPTRSITSLVNTKFKLSYKESSITNVIGKINKKEGEESRLLAVANRYPWKTVTNDERNALNKTSHGYALYNDEQRSYALYCFARGIPIEDIVTTFNQQFSMDVSLRNLNSLIWRTRSKRTERDEILNAARNYTWFTDPIPQNHRPLSPSQHWNKGATDNSAASPHTKPSASKPAATRSGATHPAATNPLWTTEEKAYAIHHTDCGMSADDLLDCLNAQFRTTRDMEALVDLLSLTQKTRSRVAHLRQQAKQFDWYAPDAPLGHARSSTPPPTSALHAPLSPLTTASAHASPSINSRPSPALRADYGAPRFQFASPAPLPSSSPHWRDDDVMQDWGRLSPRLASPEPFASPERQGPLGGCDTPLGDRRSRSPLTAGPFWFGEEEDEEVGMRG